MLTTRLIVGLEAAVVDRLTQLELQAAPRFGALIHAGLEEAVGAPSVGLGAVEREVRIPQQLVEVHPVTGRKRYSDAGIGGDQMPHARQGLPDRRMDFINEPSSFRPVLDSGLNDGELIAAEPGRNIGFLEATAQPLGDALEQLVANRMAERVVDAFELVDVDVEHRQLLARPYRPERAFQPLAELDPVRQVGQAVVVRQMLDLLVRAAALGDVLDGRDPSAALQRPVDDFDRPATRRFRQLARCLAERHRLDDRVAEFIDVAIERSGFLPVSDQPLHGAAGLGHIGRQSEHVEIGLVANDDPRRCIIENKTLRDVVHGNRELAPLRRQPPVGQSITSQQQSGGNGKHGDNRKQHAFAKTPCRCRQVGRNDRREQPPAHRKQFDRSAPLRRTDRTARYLMTTLVAHPTCL
ncbi:hypothetical protein V1285_006554 [Bradyrhizobium sp. AZCC 1620]